MNKKAVLMAVMGLAAAMTSPDLYLPSGFNEGHSVHGTAPKTQLSAKRKKARRANKKASKSRAKNRRKK